MMRIIKAAAVVIGALCAAAGGHGQASALDGTEVADLVETLEVGRPVYYENLTVIPVYTASRSVPHDIVTLDRALANKWLKITEIEGGRVPQVEVSNQSDRYVFLMGGEILTGCRQDRIVGRDVLLGPRSKNVTVPVYCVEQGRWTYESEEFYSKSNLGTSEIRAEAQKATGFSQANIWSEVGEMHARGGRPGETRFQVMYDSDEAKDKIGAFEARMAGVPTLYPDAIGVVIGVGHRVASVDVFTSRALFAELWPKILRSAALAAMGRDSRGSITQADAADFLSGLHDRRYAERPAVDLGAELVVVSGGVNASALVYGGAVLHLAGFPETDSKAEDAGQDSERRIPVIRRTR
jgi:hypothetical protein